MSENREQEPVGVDIVIPCYQYGRFLRDCVTSVLSQSIQEIRVLIIDNASTDDSVEVAQQLAAEDRRVEVVAHQTNLGQHASFNEGIDWAASKYFTILCADDLLAPGCLAHAVSIMDQHSEVGFVYGQAIWLSPQRPMPALDVDPDNAPWRIIAGKDLLERFFRTAVNHILGPVVVTSVAQKLAGYYRTELQHSDDFEMRMRLARLGPAAETEAPLGIVRLHGSSRSAFVNRVHTGPALPGERDRMLYNWHDEAAIDSFFAHEGRLLPEAARLHRLARRSIVERAYWQGLAELCRGKPNASRNLLKFAFKRRPSTTIVPPFNYLFRRDDVFDKLIAVASEMVRRSRAPAEPAALDGRSYRMDLSGRVRPSHATSAPEPPSDAL